MDKKTIEKISENLRNQTFALHAAVDAIKFLRSSTIFINKHGAYSSRDCCSFMKNLSNGHDLIHDDGYIYFFIFNKNLGIRTYITDYVSYISKMGIDITCVYYTKMKVESNYRVVGSSNNIKWNTYVDCYLFKMKINFTPLDYIGFSCARYISKSEKILRVIGKLNLFLAGMIHKKIFSAENTDDLFNVYIYEMIYFHRSNVESVRFDGENGFLRVVNGTKLLNHENYVKLKDYVEKCKTQDSFSSCLNLAEYDTIDNLKIQGIKKLFETKYE